LPAAAVRALWKSQVPSEQSVSVSVVTVKVSATPRTGKNRIAMTRVASLDVD